MANILLIGPLPGQPIVPEFLFIRVNANTYSAWLEKPLHRYNDSMRNLGVRGFFGDREHFLRERAGS